MRNGQRPTPSEDYHRASRCESEIMATMSLRKNSRNSGPPPTSSVPFFSFSAPLRPLHRSVWLDLAPSSRFIFSALLAIRAASPHRRFPRLTAARRPFGADASHSSLARVDPARNIVPSNGLSTGNLFFISVRLSRIRRATFQVIFVSQSRRFKNSQHVPFWRFSLRYLFTRISLRWFGGYENGKFRFKRY